MDFWIQLLKQWLLNFISQLCFSIRLCIFRQALSHGDKETVAVWGIHPTFLVTPKKKLYLHKIQNKVGFSLIGPYVHHPGQMMRSNMSFLIGHTLVTWILLGVPAGQAKQSEWSQKMITGNRSSFLVKWRLGQSKKDWFEYECGPVQQLSSVFFFLKFLTGQDKKIKA